MKRTLKTGSVSEKIHTAARKTAKISGFVMLAVASAQVSAQVSAAANQSGTNAVAIDPNPLFSAEFSAEFSAASEPTELPEEGKHKITFDPFHLSLMKRGKLQGSVDLQIVLQVHDNKEFDDMNALKPILRADIVSALSTLARQRWTVTQPIDPDIVSAYLTPFISHRVGAKKLDVFVLQALITPK